MPTSPFGAALPQLPFGRFNDAFGGDGGAFADGPADDEPLLEAVELRAASLDFHCRYNTLLRTDSDGAVQGARQSIHSFSAGEHAVHPPTNLVCFVAAAHPCLGHSVLSRITYHLLPI